MRSFAFLGFASSIAVAGCAEGTGTVAFTSWGEEYIEQEIPAEAFADGYTVKYSKFLVVVGEIAFTDGTKEEKNTSAFLIDHVTPGVKSIATFAELPEGDYTNASYALLAADTSTELQLVGGATAADAGMMKSMGYHLYVEGTLSKGGVSKTFAWGFGEPTELGECEGEIDGKVTPGVVVTDGGTDTVELTIHGDHLFYDDLQSPSAVVRGDAIFAADADMNGIVDQAELTAVKLTSLPAGQYGTGGVDGVNDLGTFVAFLSKTVGHWRGEGECFIAGGG